MSSARNAIEAQRGGVEFIVLMSALMALTALARCVSEWLLRVPTRC